MNWSGIDGGLGCLLDLNINASSEWTERQPSCCPRGVWMPLVRVGLHSGVSYTYTEIDHPQICLILQKWRILLTVLVRKTSKQINLYRADVTFYLFTVYQPPGIISICFQIKEHFSLNVTSLHLWWYSKPIFVFIYMWFVRPQYSYTHMLVYAHECLILKSKTLLWIKVWVYKPQSTNANMDPQCHK